MKSLLPTKFPPSHCLLSLAVFQVAALVIASAKVAQPTVVVAANKAINGTSKGECYIIHFDTAAA
jgi:hypothetical protein